MADMKQKSDFSRAFSEDGTRKTHVGGQALIEGIMMRGRHNWAVAVREPKGDIYTEEHDLGSGRKKNGWMYWPLIRGCRAMAESLILGYKALEIAALHAFEDEEEDAPGAKGAPGMQEVPAAAGTQAADAAQAASAADGGPGLPGAAAQALGGTGAAPAASEDGFGKKAMAFSMVLGVVLGAVLFIVAPAALTNLIVGEYDSNPLAWNIVDGLLRVVVFVFYIWLIGRMEDIRRMFGYHGAEHKTIHCYEHGLPLTPENARQFPRLHVRCGTAFLIMVMVIAIVVYTVIPLNALIAAWGVPDGLPKLLLVIAVRILFMPVIAGISYEITVRWAGSRPDNPLVKVILWPGMQMQYLTTNEPDDGQIECAIASMQLVLEREEAEEERSRLRASGQEAQEAAPATG